MELDQPHKVWTPGETVTGTAVLDLKKNVTDVNIALTLVGYIKVKMTQPASTGRRKPTVLFRHTSIIYGFDQDELSQREHHDEPTIGLSKGEHRFPFSVKLPRKNIFTSINFERGSIAYSLRASINHNEPNSPMASLKSSPASQMSSSGDSIIVPYPKNSIHHCEKNLNIVVPINVAKIPKPHTKFAYLKITDRKLFKTISSASTINSNATHSTVASETSNDDHSTSPVLSKDQAIVRLAVDLPQSGFLRGETIPLKIKVTHYKPVQVSSGLIITLIRLCRVDNGPESTIDSFRKDLCQTIAPLYIDPHTLTVEISTSLKVPVDAFPTIIGSDIVTFRYYIEILVNVSNKNIIKDGSTQMKKNSVSKFSNSIMFSLDQEHDHMTLLDDGMVNVDHIKRAKNMLGLNTEIIVGTDRMTKSKDNVGKQTILNNARFQQQQDGVQDVDFNELQGSLLEDMSTTSISPISINDASGTSPNGQLSVGDRSVVSTGVEISTPDLNEGLSEKEIMRRTEASLLPSEPLSHPDDLPLPSYNYTNPTSMYTAPPMRGLRGQASQLEPQDSTVDQNSDKAELERRRLMDLESEPPEFDYVPEYNLAGQDYSMDTGGSASLSSNVVSSELETLKG